MAEKLKTIRKLAKGLTPKQRYNKYFRSARAANRRAGRPENKGVLTYAQWVKKNKPTSPAKPKKQRAKMPATYGDRVETAKDVLRQGVGKKMYKKFRGE